MPLEHRRSIVAPLPRIDKWVSHVGLVIGGGLFGFAEAPNPNNKKSVIGEFQ